jgi:RNA polymerase sigma-70 factor (ECF subfamily)
MALRDDVEPRLRELFVAGRASPSGRRLLTEALSESYHGDIRRFVASHLRGDLATHVDDACQETWESVPKALETFAGDSTFLTWLTGIAKHKVADVVRRAQRRRQVEQNLDSIISKLVASSRARPSVALAREQDAALVRRVREELTQAEQEILSLHYEEDMDVRDIARVRGIPANTIAQQLLRLRRRLKKRIEELLGG